MLENRVKIVYLGIGSNLGDRKKNIEEAKINLIRNNINILKCSNYYESLSWPDIKNPSFLNIVINVSTNLSATKLLEICKKIEIQLGRKKGPKNSPRECDIDIIDYNKEKSIGNIILPHPLMHLRNFVLFPLFEINKDWKHPVSKHHIKTLIFTLSNKDIRSIKQI